MGTNTMGEVDPSYPGEDDSTILYGLIHPVARVFPHSPENLKTGFLTDRSNKASHGSTIDCA